MTTPALDRDELRQMLRRYNEQPEQREEITSQIETQFTRTLGILALDSSGFTRTVRRTGIVHFLALLERLERIVRPIIAANNGRLLRADADNVFAIFTTAKDAVAAARGIALTMAAVNEALAEQDELYISIGVGFGPVLQVGEDDIYGDEMNLACKLGEDLAQRGEVLLTGRAFEALGKTDLALGEQGYTVSGIEITAYRLDLSVY